MTIRIYVHQRKGIKTKKCVDDYEFCCWESLHQWLHKFGLHKCPNCKKKTKTVK